MSIRASVGNRGVNQSADVRLVQELLNRQKAPAYTYGPVAVDGLIGPQTIGAITTYQKNVVKLPMPDGRVDPGGQTITALERNANRSPSRSPAPPPPPPAGGNRLFTITFKHGRIVPPARGTDIYESSITIDGPRSATFRGSIYPDDMNEYGRLEDGIYDLSLTFHRKEATPTVADLKVKIDGPLRPALTVNDGGTVPVISLKSSKTTSIGINVHNGFSPSRGSKGCLTIEPSEWTRFIRIFLDLYPNFSDWYEGNGSFRGRKIGKLHVQA